MYYLMLKLNKCYAMLYLELMTGFELLRFLTKHGLVLQGLMLNFTRTTYYIQTPPNILHMYGHAKPKENLLK